MRLQKKDTKLFFDSLKHIKNNLSNMIYYEIFTLLDCNDLNEYIKIKPVNYKSKIPDMKKFGLIDYKNIRDNIYKFTEYGNEVVSLLDEIGKSYRYYNHDIRLESINYDAILAKIGKHKAEKLQNLLLKMLFSYYDSADSLRPYYLLFRMLSKYCGYTLTDDLFFDILAQSKVDVINDSIIIGNAFNKLNIDLKEEIARPKPYITDVLKITGFIDANKIIKISRKQVDEINNGLSIRMGNDYDIPPSPGRPADEQSRFREGVLKAYNYKCAITGKCIAIKQKDNSYNYMLDAAHIIPYSDGGSFSINNGIALSREMHRLFDRNLIAFDYNDKNELEVIVTNNTNVIDDGTLAQINHKIIKMPEIQYRPTVESLLYRIERLM